RGHQALYSTDKGGYVMKPDLNKNLEGMRAFLRPLTKDDEGSLQEIANDEALWIYGIADLSKAGELKKYIANAIADRNNGICAVWVIIDKKTNRVAGCTRLSEISWRDERGQVGWTW